ncbi:UNVERIFIED_CONTAM: hypothetical protein PYX00_007029 [Menopon gallinae]|uniref:Signal recognition particle 14 kDa protein n=1 Tax=Menopon gallinae TaxID=328185 RepID=A0AAW2HHY8_9NEOP
MVLLNNTAFLTELTRMFQKSRLQGSVSVTMKRYDGRKRPKPREGKEPLPEPTEYYCLMRATCKSKKISTVVQEKDVIKFQVAYCSLLKGNLDGLKKLKKGKTKAKAT